MSTPFNPNDPKSCREWLVYNSAGFSMFNMTNQEGGRMYALALAHAKRMTEPCRWAETKPGDWQPACVKGATQILDGPPKENYGINFCQFCGHPIEEVSLKRPSFENPTKGLKMTLLPIKMEKEHHGQ